METARKILGTFLSLPVFLASLGIAGVLLALAAAMLWYAPVGSPAPQPTAVIAVIPGPTMTPYLPSPTPTRAATATSNMPPSPMPGMIGVGAYVQIAGTEGSGLNIRSGPGLANDVNFLAYDAEAFEVQDGPVEADGIVWWYLVTPVDAGRAGWAAANYLAVVPSP